MKLTISIAQTDVRQGKPEENLARGLQLIEEAARRGTQLLCFPEMWTTGFDWERNRRIAAGHEKIIGSIAAEAARHGMWISSPTLSRTADGRTTNTSFLFDPEGRRVAAYSKTHLFSLVQEEQHMRAGNELTIVDAPWGRTGIAICYDIRFPELFRTYALQGVVLQICSAAFPHPRRDHWRVLTRARAIENQFFMIAINRVGQEMIGAEGSVSFFGASSIIDPWGNRLVEAGETQCLLTATIDLEQVAAVRKHMAVFDDRRPDLYRCSG